MHFFLVGLGDNIDSFHGECQVKEVYQVQCAIDFPSEDVEIDDVIAEVSPLVAAVLKPNLKNVVNKLSKIEEMAAVFWNEAVGFMVVRVEDCPHDC